MMLSSSDGNTKDNADIANISNIRVENFRPNIVISNAENIAHMEDSYHQLQIPLTLPGNSGEIGITTANFNFEVTGPCARCLMVNVNSNNGTMDCKVFEALRSYRYADRSVYFGQFLTMQTNLAEHILRDTVDDIVAVTMLLPRISVGALIDVTMR
jgi:uncharacterized protein YcbX